jgi:hypothetical protein
MPKRSTARWCCCWGWGWYCGSFAQVRSTCTSRTPAPRCATCANSRRCWCCVTSCRSMCVFSLGQCAVGAADSPCARVCVAGTFRFSWPFVQRRRVCSRPAWKVSVLCLERVRPTALSPFPLTYSGVLSGLSRVATAVVCCLRVSCVVCRRRRSRARRPLWQACWPRWRRRSLASMSVFPYAACARLFAGFAHSECRHQQLCFNPLVSTEAVVAHLTCGSACTHTWICPHRTYTAED